MIILDECTSDVSLEEKKECCEDKEECKEDESCCEERKADTEDIEEKIAAL